MKNVILLITFFFSLAGSAQENFKAVDGQLQWQKIYKMDLDKKQLQDLIAQDAILNPIAANFAGHSYPDKVNCSPLIFMQQQFTYFAQVAFKGDNYRVTISNINFIPDYTVEIYGVESSQAPIPAADYLIKNNGQIRPGQTMQDALKCLDGHFAKKFQFAGQDPDGWQ